MRKAIIIALLVAVLLKMIYNVYSFIHGVQFGEVEHAMRIMLISLLVAYLVIVNRKKQAKKSW